MLHCEKLLLCCEFFLCIDVRVVGHSRNWLLYREFLCFDKRGFEPPLVLNGAAVSPRGSL